VDLDGTLIRTNSLHTLIAAALRDPFTLVRIPGFLLRGKAGFKSALAARVSIDVAALPYHQELLEWLRAERRNGRRLVLATASTERVAMAISEHLGVFDEVIASSAHENLRGEAKADALVRRFGERGFDYVGNDDTDLAVWGRARAAILVAASNGLRERAERIARIDREFPRERARPRHVVP
jgi:phosphoserine phosphatase